MTLPRIQTEEERINIQYAFTKTITLDNGLSYDIHNGHFYIDGRYGYGIDQRICDDNEDGTCNGVTN